MGICNCWGIYVLYCNSFKQLKGLWEICARCKKPVRHSKCHANSTAGRKRETSGDTATNSFPITFFSEVSDGPHHGRHTGWTSGPFSHSLSRPTASLLSCYKLQAGRVVFSHICYLTVSTVPPPPRRAWNINWVKESSRENAPVVHQSSLA